MAIKYGRLSTGENSSYEKYIKLAKSKIPIAFLRQQIFLVSIGKLTDLDYWMRASRMITANLFLLYPLIVISSLLLLIFTRLFTSSVDDELMRIFPSEINYGVVVDCGSSGSRAHIFKWKPDSRVPNIEYLRDEKSLRPLNKHITPGLSSLSEEPDKASDYMVPIMKFVSESIPSDKHLETPVYFMATAGLRLLETSTQKKILTDITRDLRAKFDFPRIKSLVISGTYEGVYSWLSLNIRKYLSENLNPDIRSYGMIEMGGASVQVAFELTPEVENNILKGLTEPTAIESFRREQVTIEVGGGRKVKLFATTFLGLGVNSARDAAINLLIGDHVLQSQILDGAQSIKNTTELFEHAIKDPCLTVGSSEHVERPTSLLEKRSVFTSNQAHNKGETFKVQLEGTGNFLNCIELLDRLITVGKREWLNCAPSQKTCPMSLLGTNFIPYTYHPFIGLSEMFFTTNEMMNSAGLFNRSKVLHETNRICNTQYNRLSEMYSKGGVSFQDRILYECFKASWLLTILHDSGFRMPNDYNDFRNVDRLNDEEIDWTMGAIITEIALNKDKPRQL